MNVHYGVTNQNSNGHRKFRSFVFFQDPKPDCRHRLLPFEEDLNQNKLENPHVCCACLILQPDGNTFVFALSLFNHQDPFPVYCFSTPSPSHLPLPRLCLLQVYTVNWECVFLMVSHCILEHSSFVCLPVGEWEFWNNSQPSKRRRGLGRNKAVNEHGGKKQ